jgi:NAD(P)-dependent dehydrogenase (short-subunit alcohol dehydrogenase family)
MTQKSLEGKVLLVTGATRGIGKGIAIGLGEARATVYITGRTQNPPGDQSPLPGSLAETKLAVEAAGGICIPVVVDHSQDEQIKSLFERIQDEQNGQLDGLVNNVYAGVQALTDNHVRAASPQENRPFWESEPSLWDAVNQVGLRSHYVASIWAARMMIPRRQGLICTISSWGGIYEIFGVAYGVGKEACDRLAGSMAKDLKPHNIASVALWPGIVGTENIIRFMEEASGTENAPPNDFAASAIVERYNWETPLLTGRVITALAADPKVMRYTGRVLVVAELAQRYGVVDEGDRRPVSMRSLRFVLPFFWPVLRAYASFIPDFKIAWFLLWLGLSRF